MLELDHLVVSAPNLAEGVAWVEARLGVALDAGGEHAFMGTHNRLLSLGPECYLEVIAINPAAPAPGRPRWFDLDTFSGKPLLTHWVCRTDDLGAAILAAPNGVGVSQALERGDLRWRMAVPADGKLPFDGAFPALIDWQGGLHPCQMLPDKGCRLASLDIEHPEAEGLAECLSKMMDLDRISVQAGTVKKLVARLNTPSGLRVLN